MRDGSFEVKAFAVSNDVELEETAEGFIVAKPGIEYYLKIRIYKSKETVRIGPCIKVGLFVDGVDVLYWKRIDLSTNKDEVMAETTFHGFKNETVEVKTFVFQKPRVMNADKLKDFVKSPSDVGVFKVVFYEAEVVNETFANNIKSTEKIPVTTFVSDSEKFWKQASVGTSGGRTVTNKEVFKPLPKWINKTKEPFKILLAKYHTEEQIRLMQHGGFHDEPCNSLSSLPPTENRCHGMFVDLTDTDDETEGTALKKTKTDHQTHDDIQFIPVVKEIPLLDISMDDDEAPVWSTVIEHR